MHFRHWRWACFGCSVVTVAVVLVVPVASVFAAVTKERAVPERLIGAWTRNVTVANWQKYPDAGIGPTGLWTMVIKKRGGADVYTPNGYRPGCVTEKEKCYPDFSLRSTLAGNRWTVSPIPPDCPAKGLYAWKVSGRVLTLRVIADKQCLPREAIFAGSWKRARA